MPSKEVKAQVEQLDKENADLRRSYLSIKDSLAINDLLEVIDNSYNSSYYAAVKELEKPAKAQAALQHAHAYDKIRLYIREMMS